MGAATILLQMDYQKGPDAFAFFLDIGHRIKALFIRFNTPFHCPWLCVGSWGDSQELPPSSATSCRRGSEEANLCVLKETDLTMKLHRMLLRIVLLAVTFCAAAWAQDTGSITGTVKDPSGASISNAEVVVSSADHGIDRRTVTNSSGDYNESGLPGGTYDVSVTAGGFKKYQAKGVVLRVAEKARVDVALQVGASSIEVTVEGAEVAQVETQSSGLTGTVTGKQVTQL